MSFNKEITASRILEDNAVELGLNLAESFKRSSKKLCDLLLAKYSEASSYTIVCGNGNNGADGLALALELADRGLDVFVFLLSRSQKLETKTASHLWQEVVDLSKGCKNLSYVQETDISLLPNADVIIDAIIGTGLKGKLTKRFRDTITRMHHFKKPIIALDLQTPGYTPALTISLGYPKVADCEVIPIEVPSELLTYVGVGEINALSKIKKGPYKSQNGKVVIITDTKKGIPEEVKNYVSKIVLCDLGDLHLESNVSSSDIVCLLLSSTERVDAKFLLYYLLSKHNGKKYLLNDNAYFLIQHNYPELLLCSNNEGINNTYFLVVNRAHMQITEAKELASSKRIFVNLQGSQNLLFGYSSLSDTLEMKINARMFNYFDPTNIDKLCMLTAAYATRNDPWTAMCAGAVSTSRNNIPEAGIEPARGLSLNGF